MSLTSNIHIGDVDAAVSSLVAHYELEGRIVLGLLAQENGDDPFARETVEVGRAYHCAWVERHCYLNPFSFCRRQGGTTSHQYSFSET